LSLYVYLSLEIFKILAICFANIILKPAYKKTKKKKRSGWAQFVKTPTQKFLVLNELSSTLIVYPTMICGGKKPKRHLVCILLMYVYDAKKIVECMRTFDRFLAKDFPGA
jgi:hypothetical protein